jgi:putative tryptophan/tyrosine transport system substrate-binding protein
MELTRSIPIVTPSGTDAVARGYAGNVARPGGNVTGFASMEVSIIGKILQTLKEIAPNVAHVSMIYNPDNPAGQVYVRSFESAAGPLGVKPIIAHVHGIADIERAAAAAAAQPDGSFFSLWTSLPNLSWGRPSRDGAAPVAGDLFRACFRDERRVGFLRYGSH